MGFSLCTGLGIGGWPVSMQFIAKPFAETTLQREPKRAKDTPQSEQLACERLLDQMLGLLETGELSRDQLRYGAVSRGLRKIREP
jgi:hypothetical protein